MGSRLDPPIVDEMIETLLSDASASGREIVSVVTGELCEALDHLADEVEKSGDPFVRISAEAIHQSSEFLRENFIELELSNRDGDPS